MERSGRLDSNSSEWAPHSTSGEHKSSNSLSRTRKGDNCGADFLDILFTCDQCGIPSLCLGELGVAKSENERSFARENYSLGAGLTSQVKQHTTGPESTDAVPEGTLVALKLFTSRGGDDSVTARTNRREVCQLILREVEALCHPVLSSHPNIVRLLFIGWKVEESFPILAMELGSYGSLDHVIRGPGSGLTTSQKQHISIDIALGLHAIHEAGFIHGDLKPDNVIILAHDDPNRQLVAKILDFGGSSKRSHGKASAPAHTTKLWSAPEVLNCDSDVDWEKADVYSFGLIFASLWARLQHGGFGLHRFDQTSSCCLLEYVPSQVTDEVRYMMFWVMKSSPENGQNSLLHLLSSRLPRILPAEIRIADVLDILRATLKRYFWERISLGGLIQGLSFLAKDVGRDTLVELGFAKTSQGRFKPRPPSYYPIRQTGFWEKPRDYQAAIIHQYRLAIEEIDCSDPYEVTVTDIPDDPECAESTERFLEIMMQATINMIPVTADRLPSPTGRRRLQGYVDKGHFAYDLAEWNLSPLGTQYDWETGIHWMITSALHGCRSGIVSGTLMAVGTTYESRLPIRMYLCLLALCGVDMARNHLLMRWPALHKIVCRLIEERSKADLSHNEALFHFEVLRRFQNWEYKPRAVEMAEIQRALFVGDADRVKHLLTCNTRAPDFSDIMPDLLQKLPALGDDAAAKLLNLAIEKGAALDFTEDDQGSEPSSVSLVGLLTASNSNASNRSPLTNAILEGCPKLASAILRRHLETRIPIPDFNEALALSFHFLYHTVGAELLKLRKFDRAICFGQLAASTEDLTLYDLFECMLPTSSFWRYALLGSEYNTAYEKGLQVLLNEGLDPNSGGTAESPLYIAIATDNLTALKIYIEDLQTKGHNIRSCLMYPGNDGCQPSKTSALFHCLRTDSFRCFKYLLEEFPDLPNDEERRWGVSLITEACEQRLGKRYVELLLKRGTTIVPESRNTDNALEKALFNFNIPAANALASYFSNEELAQLLSRDEDSGNSMCFRILFSWCMKRHSGLIDSLLWLADHDGIHYYGPDNVFHIGKTPMWALVLGWPRPTNRADQIRDAKALDILFRHNTVPGKINNEHWNGRTALQTAAQNGHVEVVKLLILQGIDINVELGDYCCHGHTNVMTRMTAFDLAAMRRADATDTPENILKGGDIERRKWEADLEEIASILERNGSQSSVMDAYKSFPAEFIDDFCKKAERRWETASKHNRDQELLFASGWSASQANWPKPLPNENEVGLDSAGIRQSVDKDYELLLAAQLTRRQQQQYWHNKERELWESQGGDLRTFMEYFKNLAFCMEDEWRLPPGWELIVPAARSGNIRKAIFRDRENGTITNDKPPLYRGGNPRLSTSASYTSKQYIFWPKANTILPRASESNEDDTEQDRSSLLHYAVMKDNMSLMEFSTSLIDDIDLEDSSGWTALQLAVFHDRVEMAKVLISRGATISRAYPQGDSQRPGLLPIHISAVNQSVVMTQLLIDAGADPNQRTVETVGYHSTVLHFSLTQCDNPLIFEILIRAGADVNSQIERFKTTPLMLAAALGRENSARILLENGADIDLQDVDGNTALRLAAMGNHLKLAAVILEVSNAHPNRHASGGVRHAGKTIQLISTMNTRAKL